MSFIFINFLYQCLSQFEHFKFSAYKVNSEAVRQKKHINTVCVFSPWQTSDAFYVLCQLFRGQQNRDMIPSPLYWSVFGTINMRREKWWHSGKLLLTFYSCKRVSGFWWWCFDKIREMRKKTLQLLVELPTISNTPTSYLRLKTVYCFINYLCGICFYNISWM